MYRFNIQSLSKRRTQIMGFAMLSVVYFHSGFDFSMIPLLQVLKQWGDIGVDIFLLMSGIGIYHSLHFKPDVSGYLKSRVRRILPAHLLVCGCWFFFLDIILHQNGFVSFFLDITSLNFWINGQLTTWYLSSLLVMQFLTPLYMECWNKYSIMKRVAVPTVLLLCLFITYTPILDQTLGHLLIFFYRIPAYLVGLAIGSRICNDKASISMSIPLIVAVLIGSVGLLVVSSGLTSFYLRWVLRYVAYLPIALMLCVLVTFLPENRLFHFFGIHSLEIYLLHEKVLWVLSALSNRIIPGVEIHSVIVNILAIFFTCVGAIVLNHILSFIFGGKGVRHRA